MDGQIVFAATQELGARAEGCIDCDLPSRTRAEENGEPNELSLLKIFIHCVFLR